MTPQEFKAWFDGFTEAFTGIPTKAQWARIKERVGEIDGRPVTERVYVDRWWPTVQPYWSRQTALPNYIPNWGVSTCGAAVSQAQSQGEKFNSISAMSALGRAEAKAVC